MQNNIGLITSGDKIKMSNSAKKFLLSGYLGKLINSGKFKQKKSRKKGKNSEKGIVGAKGALIN